MNESDRFAQADQQVSILKDRMAANVRRLSRQS